MHGLYSASISFNLLLKKRSLTRVAKVEVVVIVAWAIVEFLMPVLRIRVNVVLHQDAKQDDEDDLQDDAHQW